MNAAPPPTPPDTPLVSGPPGERAATGTFRQPFLVVVDSVAFYSAPLELRRHPGMQGLEHLMLRHWAGFPTRAEAEAFQANCPLPARVLDNADGHLTETFATARKAARAFKTACLDFLEGRDDPEARRKAHDTLTSIRDSLGWDLT